MNVDRIRKLGNYRWSLIGLEASDAVLSSRSGYLPFLRRTKTLWQLLQNGMAHTFRDRDRIAHHDVYPPRELPAKRPEECDVRQVNRSLRFAQLLV